jgi:hypothetical protein
LQELSAKDAKGNVIPETEVTVSRLSRLIEEQVRFGVLGLAEERTWDRESRSWLRVCLYGVRLENGIYGHSRFCNTDFDDKLACLNLSGV